MRKQSSYLSRETAANKEKAKELSLRYKHTGYTAFFFSAFITDVLLFISALVFCVLSVTIKINADFKPVEISAVAACLAFVVTLFTFSFGITNVNKQYIVAVIRDDDETVDRLSNILKILYRAFTYSFLTGIILLAIAVALS